MTLKISVVILAKNEENNIEKTLKSVKNWVDEIIVVDMKSTDRTKDVALKYQAKIIDHENIALFDKARFVGIEKAKNDWIFVLDADEVVGEELKIKIERKMMENQFHVFFLPRLNLHFPGFSKNLSFYPEFHMRFFHRNYVNLKEKNEDLHTFFKPNKNAKIFYLNPVSVSDYVLHFSLLTVENYLQKINTYSSIEATCFYERALFQTKISFFMISIWKPLKAFFVHYFKRKAYKDGLGGFYVSLLFSFYQVCIISKFLELRLRGKDAFLPEESKKFAENWIK